MTCVDAVGKKTAFIRQVGCELRLAQPALPSTRVESCDARPFDLITSRAFASLARLRRADPSSICADGRRLAGDEGQSTRRRRSPPACRRRGVSRGTHRPFRAWTPSAAWSGCESQRLMHGHSPRVDVRLANDYAHRTAPDEPASSASRTRKAASARPRPRSIWLPAWPGSASGCWWSISIRRAMRPWARASTSERSS